MQKDYFASKNFFLVSSRYLVSLFLLYLILLPVSAVSYNELRGYMLNGDLESLLSQIESKNDLKFKLEERSAELYIMSQLIIGDLAAAENTLEYYIKKYPESSSIKGLMKNMFFFKGNYQAAEKLGLDEYEKNQLKLQSLLDEYLIDLKLYQIKNPKFINKIFISDTELDSNLKSQRKKILNLAEKITETRPYFKTRLEYLLALKDPEINQKIEQEALMIIQDKQKKLFPASLDFYELAMASKALAILSIQESKNDSAKRFIKLGQSYISKLRSIWLIEDIHYENPIMKTEEHHSKFGYLIPQWIMQIQEEFDSYLKPSATI